MKRWLIVGAAIVFVLTRFLSQTALSAEAVTGQWYAYTDGTVYVFADGIISCEDHQLMDLNGTPMSGAYAFCKDYVVLFAMGIDGLEDVTEAYLVSYETGDVLCENANGTGQVYFCRTLEP